jgi:hypothetical protein
VKLGVHHREDTDGGGYALDQSDQEVQRLASGERRQGGQDQAR